MGTPEPSTAPVTLPPGSRRRLDWYDFLVLGVHLFVRVWHGCRSNGPAPLPASGPAVIIANHGSHADPAFVTVGCKRRIYFLQAREVYESRRFRWYFRPRGTPVARDGRGTGVRRALDLLRSGEVLCVFPEGHFSPEGGKLRPFKPGAAFLALHAQAPVIPAWISCRRETESPARAALWPSWGVRVTYGRPVDLSPYWERPIDRDVVREVTALLADRLEELHRAPGS